ncbi:MAG: UvrD-helicase domain-containing protein, partial [Proteobacteria bacterium]|nr:UvrD-helicase domain-containing protein [Pseudomonadota bacterium]
MTELETNPQDPYKSLIVRASAGSGKTFQLSRRFLALVTAGADPSQILTITFSRKAAAEMRARVIADAISYGKQNQDFHGFYRNIERWRQQALIKGLTPPPLISPEKVSAAIVQNTQSLAITTIDAILMEWCLKFPIETEQVTEQDFIGSENADPVKSCTVALRAPWEIASKSDQERQHLAAWQQTLHQLSQGIPVEDRSSFFQQLLAATPGNQFKSGWKRLEHLIKSDTFIWLSEHVRGDARLFYDLAGEDVPTDEYELLAVIRTPLMRVISEIGSAEKKQLASAALADGNFPALIAAGIFKQDLTFNGTTISKKVRTAVSEFIDDVELVMTAYRNNQQLRRLNAHAKLLWVFYHTWNNEYLKARSRAGNGIFSDALKGVYALFSGEFAGARWLIQNQVKHLMLDEFQDTSRLQWSVFSGLAKDLQSGQTQDPNDLSGTVFIVGDAKQSIYGFREAAPEIVDVAAEDLKPLGMHPVEMSSSWRTADIVLEVVNEVFRNNPFMENFPVHSGARTAKCPVNIDCGSFHILPLAMMSGATAQEGQAQEIRPEFRPEVKIEYNADELESDSEVTIEATQVVEHIEHCISGLVKTPIWDKSQNKFRNPLPRDFVILYSKSTHAHAYEAALREKKIGALREEQRGFFGRQEIKDALCFLRWIAFPTDTASLCGLLRSPFCNISDRTLQALISPEEYIASDNIGDKTKDKINDKIEGKSRLNPSSFQILNRLANFEMSDLKSNNFAKLLQKALVNLSSPYVTLAKFIRESDGLRRYRGLFGPIEGPLAEANLVKLLDQIRQAGAQGISTFQALLLYLEERASDDDLGNAAGTEEAVRLMTVHKSKGLEFPIVILVDTANDWFKAETYWLRSPKLGAEGFRFIGTKSERPELDPQIVSAL